LQYEKFDDFDWYISPHFWTSLAADAGVSAPAATDAKNGVVSMSTGATDNNEVMVRSTNEVALLQSDCTLIFEARIKFAEANGDDANVAVGMADAAGADLLLDNGAGDNIANSGVLIYKVDGETTWRCACKNGSTVRRTTSTFTAGGSSYQTLRIIGRPVDGSNYEFTYFVDDTQLMDSNGSKIKHTLSFASATEMRLVAGYLKAGGATSETLLLDYCSFVAGRV
jgi:hypothetical protein